MEEQIKGWIQYFLWVLLHIFIKLYRWLRDEIQVYKEVGIYVGSLI